MKALKTTVADEVLHFLIGAQDVIYPASNYVNRANLYQVLFVFSPNIKPLRVIFCVGVIEIACSSMALPPTIYIPNKEDIIGV